MSDAEPHPPPPSPPADVAPQPDAPPQPALRSLLSLDPSVPDRRRLYDDAAVRAAVRRDPSSARTRARYPLGHARSAPLHPLSVACCLGASPPTIDALYRAHPDAIGRTDARMGYAPLHWACQYKSDPDVLRLLTREYPAALAEPGRYGCQTPLRVACLYGASAESVRVLAESYPEAARTRDRDGRTALHLAVECGGSASAEVVRVLLEACPEALGWADRKGRTALHAAFKFGAPADVAMALIEASANYEGDGGGSLLGAADRAGNTPVHGACAARAPLEVLRAMLSVDPSLAARTNRAGEVPLCLLWEALTEREMYAAIRGVPDVPPDDEEVEADDAAAAVEDLEEFRREASALRSCIRLLLRSSHYRTVDDDLPRTERGVECKFRMLHAACGVRCPRLLLDLVLERHRDEAAEKDEEGNTALGLAVRSMGRLRRDVVIASRGQRQRGAGARRASQQRRSAPSSAMAAAAAAAKDDVATAAAHDDALNRMLYAKNVAASLLELCPLAAYARDSAGQFPLHVALHGGMTWRDGAVQELARAGPEVVTVRDGRTRMFPYEMAATYARDADTVYELLEFYPHVLKNRTELGQEEEEEDGEGKREEEEKEMFGIDWNHCNIS